MVRIVVFALILSHGLFAVTSESQSIHQPPDSTQQFDPATGLLVPAEVPPEPNTGVDPETGLPVEAADSAAAMKFDPATGLMVPAKVLEKPVAGFDPVTGLPIQAPAGDTQKPVILRLQQAEGGGGMWQ